MQRFKVKKESGSRYAYVVDTSHNDERIHRFDVLKGDGWTDATKCCERMNKQTEQLAANKKAREEV